MAPQSRLLLIALFLFVLNQQLAISQNGVGIGTNTPHPSALLHLQSTDKGLLVPKMTSTQINNIPSPSNGLLVYNTTASELWHWSLPKSKWVTLDNFELVDEDEDSKIYVEDMPNNRDKVRINLNGSSALQFVRENRAIKFITPYLATSIYIGNNAGKVDTSGLSNIGIGSNTLQYINDGLNTQSNLAVGVNALQNLGNGVPSGGIMSSNIGLGSSAGLDFVSGRSNIFLGGAAGGSLTSGNYNVFVGAASGMRNTLGSNNTIVGAISNSAFPDYVQSGAVKIGFQAGKEDASDNVLHIANSDTKSLIYGEFDNELVGIDGKLGVGTNDPLMDLHIVGDATSGKLLIAPDISVSDGFSHLYFGEDDDYTFGMEFRYDGADNYLELYGEANGTEYGPHLRISRNSGQFIVNGLTTFTNIGSLSSANDLRVTSGGTLTTSSSDARLKQNIMTIPNALDKVKKLRGVSFEWKAEPEIGTQLGLVAQEVLEVVPEVVFENDGYYGVDYSELIPVLINAVAEQQAVIEELRQEVEG